MRAHSSWQRVEPIRVERYDARACFGLPLGLKDACLRSRAASCGLAHSPADWVYGIPLRCGEIYCASGEWTDGSRREGAWVPCGGADCRSCRTPFCTRHATSVQETSRYPCATRASLDGVRHITHNGSGQIGALFAGEAIFRGTDVTCACPADRACLPVARGDVHGAATTVHAGVGASRRSRLPEKQ